MIPKFRAWHLKEMRMYVVRLYPCTRGQSYTLHFTKRSSCEKKTDHVSKWGQSMNVGIFHRRCIKDYANSKLCIKGHGGLNI